MPDLERLRAIREELSAAIKLLTDSGKSVVLIQAIPWPGFDVPEYFARKAWYSGTLIQNARFPETLYSRGTMDVRILLSEVATNAGAKVIDPAKILCAGGECRVIENGEVLYSDSNHLSLSGIAFILPHLVSRIIESMPDP